MKPSAPPGRSVQTNTVPAPPPWLGNCTVSRMPPAISLMRRTTPGPVEGRSATPTHSPARRRRTAASRAVFAEAAKVFQPDPPVPSATARMSKRSETSDRQAASRPPAPVARTWSKRASTRSTKSSGETAAKAAVARSTKVNASAARRLKKPRSPVRLRSSRHAAPRFRRARPPTSGHDGAFNQLSLRGLGHLDGNQPAAPALSLRASRDARGQEETVASAARWGYRFPPTDHSRIRIDHACLSFPNHDPRPQHGRRARPLARHRHEGWRLRQADHRRGQLLHPVRARPRPPQGPRPAGRARDRGGRRRRQGVQHHRRRRRHRHGP